MRKKILLTASVNLRQEGTEVYPMLVLRDKQGNTWIGHIGYCSVESLAREYQKDNEYRSKEKFDYYFIWEGNKTEEQLFQRPVVHGYGEPYTYIDETGTY